METCIKREATEEQGAPGEFGTLLKGTLAVAQESGQKSQQRFKPWRSNMMNKTKHQTLQQKEEGEADFQYLRPLQDLDD